MEAFIDPPDKIPLFLKLGIWISKKVTYWARLMQALGIPPAGFSDQCKVQNNRTNK